MRSGEQRECSVRRAGRFDAPKGQQQSSRGGWRETFSMLKSKSANDAMRHRADQANGDKPQRPIRERSVRC